jgi:hypothetical protein
VAFGFGCILVILAVASGTAYFAFQESADGFSSYAKRVSVVGIARDVDRTYLAFRRFAREYALTSVEANVDSAKKEQTTLTRLIHHNVEI